MFYGPFFDPTMLILIPGILLAMYAQYKVSSAFEHFSRVASSRGLTGAQVAREILRRQGLDHVEVKMTEGHLSDHYDPRTKVVRLSPQVYRGTSLAALGVAAHETGHAIQHDVGYLPLNIRHSLLPVASFGSNLALPLFILGLILASPTLVKFGVYLFSAVVLFQLVTLPVEFNASSRALAVLEGHGFISRGEVPGTKAVLDAAALTYVAAALVAVLNLVRLIMLSGLFGRREE